MTATGTKVLILAWIIWLCDVIGFVLLIIRDGILWMDGLKAAAFIVGVIGLPLLVVVSIALPTWRESSRWR